MLATRGHDGHFESLDRDGVARLDGQALRAAGERFRVDLVQPVGSLARFDVGAVIDESADRESLRELRRAANVVIVVVRHDHVVDTF